MPKTLTAQLAPRQSAALWLTTMAAIAASFVAIASLATSATTLVTWCRDFVVAATAGRGAVAVALVAVLSVVALAAVLNVVAFVFTETAAAIRLARTLASTAIAVPGRVRAALQAAGVRAECAVVEDATPFAVSIGLRSPRIVVSTGLVAALTLAELKAVLAHEAHRCRERHPFRAILWESLRRAFFFLPIIGDIAGHFSLARELSADRASLAASGGTRALASAMLKAVSAMPPRFPRGIAAFGQLLPRISALRGGSGTELKVSFRSAVSTVSVFLLVCVLHIGLGSASASAASDPEGIQCRTAEERPMSAFTLSPYFSILVPQMSRVQPVQSVEIRP